MQISWVVLLRRSWLIDDKVDRDLAIIRTVVATLHALADDLELPSTERRARAKIEDARRHFRVLIGERGHDDPRGRIGFPRYRDDPRRPVRVEIPVHRNVARAVDDLRRV